MATITKRGPYQWRAQVRRHGYPAQSKTFNTKAEAEAWANMIESEMSRGIWVSRSEAETTTLYEILARYETEVSVAKKGAAQEMSILRAYRATDLAKRPVALIRSADLAKIRDDWLKVYKPATVLRRLAVLSHVFNVARKEWGMESLSNPVELLRKPQPNNARIRRIAAAQFASFVDGEDDPSDRGTGDSELERVVAASESALLPSIIWLAVETAMRRGELVALRWEYVDLRRRVAHLPATKNGSARDVPLSSRAVAVLQALTDTRNGSTDKESSETRRVFEIRGDAVTRAFERAVARARRSYVRECTEAKRDVDNKFLVDLRFHDLRHEATSRLASIFPMHELTKITGHKDPRMLMRYYHPRAEDLAKRLQ
ncbi:site-specific integrase [Burkholderia pseudomallei]|uniref:site-specific integrase n=1 Tax=Burkholderia pseudomallei TaxID=28450 RepID=UPI000977CA49|nr:site-specific integrase [Burkholderia pseudomallei]ARL50264.1 integrase [Burkholderia pseudomallei]OND93171.1 integrase [Burkholderia pseudomallei]ONE02613.1 integrase [Burkholderia pseudomallei]